jgi:hypothetical protein
MKRIAFCGVIEGSVALRPGETWEAAIARAEATINDVLAKQAVRLARIGDAGGPVVGLEVAE